MLERIRNFLAAPELKALRTARLIALESGGRARWTPRDYTALTREGYVKNAIVHRAVRLFADAVGRLSFMLFEGELELDRQVLTQWLAPAFGEGRAGQLRLAIDADRIEVLSGDRGLLWQRVTDAPFLTLNEKRAATGYGPVHAGDVFGS
jgi:phage portal protein BeeE